MKSDLFSDFISENKMLRDIEDAFVHAYYYLQGSTETFHFQTSCRWCTFRFGCGCLSDVEISIKNPQMPSPEQCDYFLSRTF